MLVLSMPVMAVFYFACQTMCHLFFSEMLSCSFFSLKVSISKEKVLSESVKAWATSWFGLEIETFRSGNQVILLRVTSNETSLCIFQYAHHFSLCQVSGFLVLVKKAENDCAVDTRNGCFRLCAPNHRWRNRFRNTLFFFFSQTEAFRRKSFFFLSQWKHEPPSTFRWEKQTILTLKLINCFASSIKWDFIFFSTHHFHLVKSMTVSFWWRKVETACAVDASNGCFWFCVPNHVSPNRFGNTFFP